MSALRIAGDRTFWKQLDTEDRVPKLMVRDKAGTRALYDPASESSTSAGPAAINSYNVSPDGRFVAIHVSYGGGEVCRSEEHTSELQSLMRISYAVFCLKKKKLTNT